MYKNNLYFAILLPFVLSLFFGCKNPVNNVNQHDTGINAEGNNTGTDKVTEDDYTNNSPDDTNNESPGDEDDNNGSDDNDNEDPGNDEDEGVEEEIFPEITNLSFTQYPYKIRTSNAVQGTVVGFIGDAEGGTPPYSYQLVNGNNDSDNNRFFIDGMNLKIKEPKLSISTYYVNLGVTNSKNKSFSIPVSITIYQDPITKDQEIRNVDGIQIAMRYVSPGSFLTMPFTVGDFEMVSINKGYWMSETTVTQELFQSVMGYNPSLFNNTPAVGERQERRPVENMTYLEAVVFCNRLSQLDNRTPVYQVAGIDNWLSLSSSAVNNINKSSINIISNGDGYRFPLEYEWEWAAVGADISGFGTEGYKKFYSGDPLGSFEGIEEYVWHYENSENITHEVGLKRPNEIGLYDMTGNVYELVNGTDFYKTGASMGYSMLDGQIQFQRFIYAYSTAIEPRQSVYPTGIRLVSNR